MIHAAMLVSQPKSSVPTWRLQPVIGLQSSCMPVTASRQHHLSETEIAKSGVWGQEVSG